MKTTIINIEEIESEIQREISAHKLEIYQGVAGWHYVRVYPDGTVTSGLEASICTPESEYFGEPGAPKTVWSQQASGYGAPREEFEWNEIEETDARTAAGEEHDWVFEKKRDREMGFCDENDTEFFENRGKWYSCDFSTLNKMIENDDSITEKLEEFFNKGEAE